MPEERPRFGRFDQRDLPGSCASGDRGRHAGCPACLAQIVRPYRVVRRYRGDRIPHDLTQGTWCELWKLRPGDVDWPDSRDG